jgi:hypothetical protein
MMVFEARREGPIPKIIPADIEIRTLRKIPSAIFSSAVNSGPGKKSMTVSNPGIMPRIARPNMILMNKMGPVWTSEATSNNSDMAITSAR